MNRIKIAIGTEKYPYIKLTKPMPGLLYIELMKLLEEFRMFECRRRNTRFQKYLSKNYCKELRNPVYPTNLLRNKIRN